MPFLSRNGYVVMTHDVKKMKFNPLDQTIGYCNEGEYEEELEIINAGSNDFDPDSRAYKEVIWSGEPNREGMYFLEDPIYRVPTNRFSTEEFWRFYKYFRTYAKEKEFFYQPDGMDFVPTEFGATEGFHFPLWVLEMIIADGLLDEALQQDDLTKPGRPRLTLEQKEKLLKAYEKRKSEESKLEIDIDEQNQINDIKEMWLENKNYDSRRRAGATRAADKQKQKNEMALGAEADKAEKIAKLASQVENLVNQNKKLEEDKAELFKSIPSLIQQALSEELAKLKTLPTEQNQPASEGEEGKASKTGK